MNGSKNHIFGWIDMANENLRWLATSMLRLCAGQDTSSQNSVEEQNQRQRTKPPDSLQIQRRMSVTSSGRQGIFTVEVDDEESLEKTMRADGYVLGPTIGEGAFGKVRRASLRTPSNPIVGRQVACKIINKLHQGRSGIIPSTFVRKYLPRELKVMRKARHPHVVQTHIIYACPSSVYVFMDYCKMGDLAQHLDKEGSIPQKQAHLFFKQICDAVDYLHQKNIAHRDIKCDNILLENSKSVKLSDFGFARWCVDEEGRRVNSDTYCGTQAYSAPEVLRKTSYNPKVSDVWSMGVVLYRMLANCFPFPRNDRKLIMAYQMARNLKSPQRNINDVAQSLFTIIFEPDVEKRATVKQIKRHPWVVLSYR